MPAVTMAGALIGRASELKTLVGLVTDVAGGQGSALLIEGEPGIGKSALVRAALADAAGTGCEVFWGAGDELGQALPLHPLLEGLRVRDAPLSPRRGTIVRLLRGEAAADRDTDLSAALAEQLLALVAEQCDVRPTILVVDDLQWADQASVALWGRLARSARQMPLMLVGMMRPVPQREDLLALRRAVGDDARLRLRGLADPAVAELVASLAGGKPDDRLMRLADGASGNPLYVTELLAALVRSSQLTVSATGAVELISGPAPGSLSAAIADRLGFVSRPVRSVLRAAALLGVDFAVPDLATVLHSGVADLVTAVEEARAAGVLADFGSRLGFRHPMIRRALYDEIPAPVRAAWHRDAGRALAEAGAPVDRVARQLLWAVGGAEGSADPMDEWMLTWLTHTADLLVGQAPEVAADLLRRAVASSVFGSARHNCLVSRFADALFRVGSAAEAEQVANRALSHVTEPDLLVDLHWTLAQCRWMVGEFAESLAALERALATPGISARHRARLLALSARTNCILGEPGKARDIAETALSVATDTGDTWALGWALHVLTIVTAVQGQVAESLALSERALAVSQADPALIDLRLLLQINKAVTMGNLDRFEEAISAARQAHHLADQVGTSIRLLQAHSALGQLYFDSGRWDEAMAEVLTLDEITKEPTAACCDLGIAALICFHRGDLAAARRYLASAVPHAARIGNRVIGPLALARSLDREHDERLHDALAVLAADLAGKIEEPDEVEDLLGDAVRLALRVGDQSAAREITGRAVALAAGSDIPHRQANARYCRGLIDHDATVLLAASDLYAAAGRPLARAKSLEAAAGYFASADDREQARSSFTLAIEDYTALGAVTDIARLQAGLRAYGIRRGPRAKHRQARSGWDSLTPTESKVAALVEEGLTNPEIAAKLFLSRRTVATHVSHILKKLDVNSRIDIAREAALRTVAPS